MRLSYKGYVIADAANKGGRAGNNSAMNASIQVRDYSAVKDGYMLMKHFTYKHGNKVSRDEAIDKARSWINLNHKI